jgi:hypothetical protein
MEIRRDIFTCIGKGVKSPAVPATRQEWERMRRMPWLKEMCGRIENGEEELKNQLPVWTPHCAEFKNNHRSVDDALKPLKRLMFDFDEKGHTNDILSKLKINDVDLCHDSAKRASTMVLAAPKVENGKLENGCAMPELQGMEVLLVEESVRRGTHVLVNLPDGMDADTAQQIMKEVTGFEPDKAVKDIARCIYMVPIEHTHYVHARLFEPEVRDDSSDSRSASRREECGERSENTSEIQAPVFPDQFKGIPYSSIISEYWNRTGGEPITGERNKRLHQLAANLRAICENSQDWLLEIMPRYGLTLQEMRTIIHSACKEPTKGSRMMDQIVNSLKGENFSEDIDEDEDKVQCSMFKVQSSKLPIGLKESLVGVPANMHLPVLCSVLPIAGAYADQVEVEYCDGNTQHLGIMSIILGEQASGKSVCKHAVDVWKRQFMEEDKLARKREEEWKERKKARKANEKAPDDPHVLIRMMPVTVSCSTLLKRFKNANGHTLYSFGEELDTLRKTNGAGSWSSKYDIYRLSFDRGEWGQDYNSDQAESGVVTVAYNWTILGTYGAMRKCFRADNIENGLSSRILVAEMPDNSFSKMPKFKKRSKEDEAKIQEAVTKLRSYSGLVETPRLRKAIEQWVEEKRVEAAKNIDRVMDTYRKRAAVIGFRAGVIYYLLTGKETKDVVDFALMMADYCLEQQMKTFGETLMNEYVSAQNEGQRYGKNHSVFDQLPPTFSVDDLKALKDSNCGESSIRSIICRWKKDSWIIKLSKGKWSKCNVR